MKLLKQTTLAAAIAAATAFTAHAGMVAMDDASLSATTGQAGVTIETTTGAAGITIGSVTYTDEGSVHIGTGTAGFAQNAAGADVAIKITGVTWDAAANGGAGDWVAAQDVTRRTIDVDTDGNLITATTNVTGNSKRTQVGSVQLRSAAQQTAGTAGATLVQDLNMIQTSGDSQADILNLSNAGNAYNGIMTKAAVVAKMTDAGFTTAEAGDVKMAIVTKGQSKIDSLSVKALDGAVSIDNLSYTGTGPNGMMESTQVIWAVGGTATAANKAGIWISGSDSVGTLTIQSVGIGGASIGSVAINNLSQAGSVQRIYGH